MNVFEKYGAKAIWDKKITVNQYVRFQDQFESKKEDKVLAYICTDTNYELYINGTLAGFSQYADFPEEKMYDTYDVTEYIKEGKNLISVLGYSQGRDSSQRAVGIPMVKFAVVEGENPLSVSSEKTKMSPAKEYRSGEIEWISQERPFNLEIDFHGDDGWRENYVSEAWENAQVADDSEIIYSPRPIKNLTLHEICTGKPAGQGVFAITDGETPAAQMQYASMAHRDRWKFMKRENGSVYTEGENNFWLMDLGKETVGYFVIDVEAEDGAILDLAFGEHLDDLRVRSFIGNRNFGFRCICREGRQKLACYIHRFAGRYLQIFAHKGVKAVHTLGIHRVEYPLPYRSTLKSGDRLFDRIYQVAMNTLHNCMHEHYEDCPQREQALYGFDSRNEMLMSYYSFGETKMPRACLDLLSQHSWECGLLTHIAPGSYWRTIPSFSMGWVTALKEYALFSGDMEFVEKNLSKAKGVLEFMASNKKDGVILQPDGDEYWNFYGWMPGLYGDNHHAKPDAPATAFLGITLKNYADIAEYLNKPEEKAWAEELRQELAGGFHDCFYVPEKKAYQSFVDGEPHFAQLTQAIALLAGFVPEAKKEEIIAAMLNEDLVAIELSYLIYKYDALMQTSRDYAEVVLDDIEKMWGSMLYAGATSFWETSRGADDFGYAASLCHGWAAVPVYVFWRYMMGVYPEKPGVVERINPPIPGWEKASGTLLTPEGIKEF